MNDPWIAARSPVDAAKLHAIGVVAMSWNLVESMWEQILWEYFNVSPNHGHLLTRGMGIVTIMGNVADASKKDKMDLINAIKDAMAFTIACNTNRNQMVHAHVTMDRKLRTGRSKNALIHHALPDSTEEIRRVADDLIRMRGYLWDIAWHLIERRDNTLEAPPLPERFSPPALLVVPPQTNRSKPQRQPRSSRSKGQPPKA